MRNKDAEPEPCGDCGHLVYPTFVVPVRRQQQSCRVLVSGSPSDGTRCGCENTAHRLPTMRPRHRLSEAS
jgi:hypothetical protein